MNALGFVGPTEGIGLWIRWTVNLANSALALADKRVMLRASICHAT